MKRSAGDTAMVIVFLVFIILPVFFWPLAARNGEGENTENRKLAEMPDFSFGTLEQFPQAFEEYLNDHMPLRSTLIQMNSMMRYYLFHSSTNENVIPGSDGWLFYRGEASLLFYDGKKRYTEEQLQQIRDNMKMLQAYCEERGMKFAIFIAPNKERMYSEYMPKEYGEPARECALSQVLNTLVNETNIPVIYPYDVLTEAKTAYPDRLIYHKTDTHWNEWGAYLGVKKLLGALQVEMDKQGITVGNRKDNPGDLANMLNLGTIMDAGEQCTVSGYEAADTEVIRNEFFGEVSYRSASRKTGKLLMFRDSFCTAMAPYLGNCFTESVLVHYDGITKQYLKEVDADYFVLEIVERSLDRMLDISEWL